MQREMEAHLDCRLPCSQLHVVFLPPAALQGLVCGGGQSAIAAGANIILVGCVCVCVCVHMGLWEVGRVCV
jgi:hypothetical protein